VARHFKVPHGVWLREATAVATDSRDFVYVFNRGNVPLLVFDPAGNCVESWGNSTPDEGTELVEHPSFALFNGSGAEYKLSRWRGSEFMRPHAIEVDHEDNLWLVDDLANMITKCDRVGNRLMIICPDGVVLRSADAMGRVVGTVAEPPPAQSGRMFNRPTDVCVDPATGEIFVSVRSRPLEPVAAATAAAVAVTAASSQSWARADESPIPPPGRLRQQPRAPPARGWDAHGELGRVGDGVRRVQLPARHRHAPRARRPQRRGRRHRLRPREQPRPGPPAPPGPAPPRRGQPRRAGAGAAIAGRGRPSQVFTVDGLPVASWHCHRPVYFISDSGAI
jgi:hypothetical protein